MMFTSWSWNLLGFSFAFSGLLTLYVDDLAKDYDPSEIIHFPHMKLASRICILLFEISAPAAMLVSVVVKYVLWPKALAGHGSANLKQFKILLQHNANIIMCLVEVGLLGGLPIRLADMALAPLFGIAYILFAWSMRFRWVPSGDAQFVYFFLDTTLPGKTSTIALAGLLVMLLLFYGIFMLVDDVILLFGGSFVTHALMVTIFSCIVCRFRD